MNFDKISAFFRGLGGYFLAILEFRHCRNSVIEGGKAEGAISFKIPFKIPSLRGRILNFSGVLGAVAPKGLGRSPYKICELGLSSPKASKKRILEFLSAEILGSSPWMTENSKIP